MHRTPLGTVIGVQASGFQPLCWSRAPRKHSICSRTPCLHICKGELKMTDDHSICLISSANLGLYWQNSGWKSLALATWTQIKKDLTIKLSNKYTSRYFLSFVPSYPWIQLKFGLEWSCLLKRLYNTNLTIFEHHEKFFTIN